MTFPEAKPIDLASLRPKDVVWVRFEVHDFGDQGPGCHDAQGNVNVSDEDFESQSWLFAGYTYHGHVIPAPVKAKPLEVGEEVQHKTFGYATVLGIHCNTICVIGRGHPRATVWDLSHLVTRADPNAPPIEVG